VCSQLLEAASIFEVCDLSCTELLERLKRVERADPSSDLVEYFHTFADVSGQILISFFPIIIYSKIINITSMSPL
jgi:hypothetical protein